MATDFSLVLNKFGGLRLNDNEEALPAEGESPKMKNFTVTPSRTLTVREGFRTLSVRDGRVRCLWQGTLSDERVYLALIGKTLYRSRDAFATLEEVGVIEGERDIRCIEFREKLYFLTDAGLVCYDGTSLAPIEAYRPLIRISTPAEGGGTPFEDVNLLTRKVRQTFSPTGEDVRFCLADYYVSLDYVRLNGKDLTPVIEYEGFENKFVDVFPKGGNGFVPEGTNTLEIGYTIPSNHHSSEGIELCRYGITYGADNDTRAFLYGNPHRGAFRYYSGLVDGIPSLSYFPASNFSMVGDGEEITAIIRHYDRQIIFTPHSTYYSYPETQTDQNGLEYTSFPVYTLSATRGNISAGTEILLDNRPLSVMPSGLYLWNSTSIRDERNAVCFSERIAPALQKEDLTHARFFLRKQTEELYLILSCGIYVYNRPLDLFYYYEGFLPTLMLEDDENHLFFGTEDGKICRVTGDTDDGRGIDAEWHSGSLYAPDRTKTKNLNSVSLGVSHADTSPLLLGWSTDNSVNKTVDMTEKQTRHRRLFDFRNTDFSSLSFETADHQKSRKRRVRAKRFSSIRLKLVHPSHPSQPTITHLVLHGKTNDQLS